MLKPRDIPRCFQHAFPLPYWLYKQTSVSQGGLSPEHAFLLDPLFRSWSAHYFALCFGLRPTLMLSIRRLSFLCLSLISNKRYLIVAFFSPRFS